MDFSFSEEQLAIRAAIENEIKQYARGKDFVVPMAAHVIVVSKT